MSGWGAFIKSLLLGDDDPEPERRAADRVVIPACPRCRSRDEIHVESRTPGAVYFQCGRCHETIILNKPKP